MINWLTNPLKKRVAAELKKILYEHPRYRADSDNVQNKYSFKERPQRGVIINAASAERVRLSADNYVGRLTSFCMLAPISAYPGTTLEWVRENFPVLEQVSPKRDVFPSPPGVYIINIESIPNEGKKIPGTFTVEPVLTVLNEPLLIFSSSADSEAQLSHDLIYPGSVRLWIDGRRKLVPDVDFHVDYDTSQITFLKSTPTGSFIHADYRYKTPTQGPYQFQPEETNLIAIPGAVLAFGDRVHECDKMAVVITEDRTEVADVYGGKFETRFELVAFTRDSEDREKLSDYLVIKILERQNALGYEGLELIDVSPGGESEEIYNDETDEYYYESTISVSFRVDWAIHVPLPVVVDRVEMTSQEAEQEHGYLDGSVPYDQVKIGTYASIAGVPSSIRNQLTYERVL